MCHGNVEGPDATDSQKVPYDICIFAEREW